MKTKIGLRKWLSFIVAGLVGQLAWAIENNYLNLYVFDCTGEYTFIPIMVAASALAATVTTLLMGALSDRLGKRKAFISFGYILWGASIILFAFLNPKSTFNIVASIPLLSGTMIVIMDCVMTFFGSTANDASFNAFVTDNTKEDIRGKVESVLSIFPLLSMIVVVGVAGVLTDTVTNKVNWTLFFVIFGVLTLLAGTICIFLIPKDTVVANKNETYFKNIFYGFRPTVIKSNSLLYVILLAFMIYSIGIQVFMPYLIVYIQNVLLVVGDTFTIALVAILLIASIITVIFGLFMDRIGKNRIMVPAVLVSIAGCYLMFILDFETGLYPLLISGIVLMTGFMVSTAVFGSKIRDYTPKNEVGLFQGIRMIFLVLLPMVTGPYIGLGVSYIQKTTYTNEYYRVVVQPNRFIFLFAGIVMLLAFIPIYIILKKEKENASVK